MSTIAIARVAPLLAMLSDCLVYCRVWCPSSTCCHCPWQLFVDRLLLFLHRLLLLHLHRLLLQRSYTSSWRHRGFVHDVVRGVVCRVVHGVVLDTVRSVVRGVVRGIVVGVPDAPRLLGEGLETLERGEERGVGLLHQGDTLRRPRLLRNHTGDIPPTPCPTDSGLAAVVGGRRGGGGLLCTSWCLRCWGGSGGHNPVSLVCRCITRNIPQAPRPIVGRQSTRRMEGYTSSSASV